MARLWASKWKEIKRLPKSGQGEAFKVQSVADDSIIAVVKTLKHPIKDQARLRFNREVNSLQLVKQSGGNVPEVLEDMASSADISDKDAYFAMEFVDGLTLNQLVETKGPLPLDDACTIALSIAATIAIGHENAVFHRDLKPDNIVIPPDTCEAVILDYGLAYNEEDVNQDITKSDEHFTSKFIILPENVSLAGNRQDPRSDVTAVCGLLFYMVTGHYVRALTDADGMAPHHRPNSLVKDLASKDNRFTHLVTFLDKGLAYNIGDRFQAIEEVIQRIHMIQGAKSTRLNLKDVMNGYTESLLRYDRTTLIARLKTVAEKTLNIVGQRFDGDFSRSFKPFRIDRLAYSGGGKDLGFHIPGLEPLQVAMGINVSLETHPM